MPKVFQQITPRTSGCTYPLFAQYDGTATQYLFDPTCPGEIFCEVSIEHYISTSDINSLLTLDGRFVCGELSWRDLGAALCSRNPKPIKLVNYRLNTYAAPPRLRVFVLLSCLRSLTSSRGSLVLFPWRVLLELSPYSESFFVIDSRCRGRSSTRPTPIPDLIPRRQVSVSPKSPPWAEVSARC